jgi:hypothetical protein
MVTGRSERFFQPVEMTDAPTEISALYVTLPRNDTWRLKSTLVVTNLLQILVLAPLLLVTSDRIWPVFGVVALQG